MASGTFSGHDAELAALAWAEASGSDQDAYWPRNFLLDERVTRLRAERYLSTGAPADRARWRELHREYLTAENHRVPSRGLSRPGARVDEWDTPETFREPNPTDPVAGADDTLHLVRVEQISTIAFEAREEVDFLRRQLLGLAAPGDRTPADELWLFGILDSWARRRPIRPLFAGFVADVEDILRSSTLSNDGRAEALRDRLGLHFLNPNPRAIDIAVFSYPIAALPRPSTPSGAFLTTPTVLDGSEYAAFFPACVPGAHGNAVGLNDEHLPPAREVLHMPFRLEARHLIFAATIRERIPDDALALARERHIRWIRASRHERDFAADTDGP